MENQQLIMSEDYLQLLKNAPEPLDTGTTPSNGNLIAPILIFLGVTQIIFAGIKMLENHKPQLNVTEPENQVL